jgi:hypothetical protein
MLGGNIEQQIALTTGIPQSQIQAGNQPFVVIKDWDLLDALTQQNIVTFLAKYGLVAAN